MSSESVVGAARDGQGNPYDAFYKGTADRTRTFARQTVGRSSRTLLSEVYMLRLHDIMTRELVTLSPEHSLRDAMSAFASHHISGAPVVANGKVVGVISLTDLAEFAASDNGVPTQRPELAEWGEWDEPRDLPEGEEPSSVYFSQLWDDAGADVVERIGEIGGPEWNSLQESTVGEVMTRDVLALSPRAPVDYAANFMRNAGIHRVLVMDNDRLLGVVTTKDISDAVADHKLTTRTLVFGASGRG